MTFEDEPLKERLFELEEEALTMDNEDECFDEELVVKDDMDKLLVDSVVVFLFGWVALLYDRLLLLVPLVFFDKLDGSLSRLNESIPLSESLSFAIGFPPPALPDFRSGTIDILPPGGLRGTVLRGMAPMSGVDTFLIDNFGLPSI